MASQLKSDKKQSERERERERETGSRGPQAGLEAKTEALDIIFKPPTLYLH